MEEAARPCTRWSRQGGRGRSARIACSRPLFNKKMRVCGYASMYVCGWVGGWVNAVPPRTRCGGRGAPFYLSFARPNMHQSKSQSIRMHIFLLFLVRLFVGVPTVSFSCALGGQKDVPEAVTVARWPCL